MCWTPFVAVWFYGGTCVWHHYCKSVTKLGQVQAGAVVIWSNAPKMDRPGGAVVALDGLGDALVDADGSPGPGKLHMQRRPSHL
jgi:hypothetical protein